jgi:hypothetical protein
MRRGRIEKREWPKIVAALFAAVVILAGAAIAAAEDNGAGLESSRSAPVTISAKCHSRAGLQDLHCTPGAVNQNVRQSNIRKNICIPNWTDTVRPPTSYTDKLKVRGIADYGYKDKRRSSYEEDHLIPLSVGGSPTSPKNLWPEPYKGVFGARTKDTLERFLHKRVCDGLIKLVKARREFRDWKQAQKRFGLD